MASTPTFASPTYHTSTPGYQSFGSRSGVVGQFSGNVSYPPQVAQKYPYNPRSGSFERVISQSRSGSGSWYGSGVYQGNVVRNSAAAPLPPVMRAISPAQCVPRSIGSREGSYPKVFSSVGAAMPPQSANTIGEELFHQRTMTRPEVTGNIVAVEKSMQNHIECMTDDQIWRLHESLSFSNQAKVFERSYVSSTGISPGSSMSSQQLD